VERGDIFSFGSKGCLEVIARLGARSGRDQILAVWCQPSILASMQHTLQGTAHGMPVIGKLFGGPLPLALHHEVGEDGTERASDDEPVYFHIVSSTSRTLPSGHFPSLVSVHHGSDPGSGSQTPYEPAIPRSINVNAKEKLSKTLVTQEEILKQVQ